MLDHKHCALRLRECWGFRGLMGSSNELSGSEEGASTRGILLPQIHFGCILAIPAPLQSHLPCAGSLDSGFHWLSLTHPDPHFSSFDEWARVLLRLPGASELALSQVLPYGHWGHP